MISTVLTFLCCATSLLSLAPTSLAANATAISSDGCVSPSGFATCLEAASTQEATCIAEAGGSDAIIIGCGWLKDVNELLCYMSDCWNKVYSCEYQYLASSYLIERGEETIPFYPAPKDAPGGCSCNMGNVLQNATASIELIQTTCSSYTFSSDYTALSSCQCCAWSAALSAFYGICPTTDPSQLGLDKLASEVKEYTSITGSCSNLNASTCLGKFGIGSADNGTYVNPESLPAGGTEALSTTTGTGYPLTSPPGGSTMTVTLLSATHTITAATYNAKNVLSGADSTASSSGSGTTGSSSSGASGNMGPPGFRVPRSKVCLGIFLAGMAWF